MRGPSGKALTRQSPRLERRGPQPGGISSMMARAMTCHWRRRWCRCVIEVPTAKPWQNMATNTETVTSTKSKERVSCVEQTARRAPAGTLPLRNGNYIVSEEQVAEWAKLCPAVDVRQSLRSMRGWLDGSPKRRKTGRGILRFIQAWLLRDQAAAQAKPGPAQIGRALPRTQAELAKAGAIVLQLETEGCRSMAKSRKATARGSMDRKSGKGGKFIWIVWVRRWFGCCEDLEGEERGCRLSVGS